MTRQNIHTRAMSSGFWDFISSLKDDLNNDYSVIGNIKCHFDISKKAFNESILSSRKLIDNGVLHSGYVLDVIYNKTAVVYIPLYYMLESSEVAFEAAVIIAEERKGVYEMVTPRLLFGAHENIGTAKVSITASSIIKEKGAFGRLVEATKPIKAEAFCATDEDVEHEKIRRAAINRPGLDYLKDFTLGSLTPETDMSFIEEIERMHKERAVFGEVFPYVTKFTEKKAILTLNGAAVQSF